MRASAKITLTDEEAEILNNIANRAEADCSIRESDALRARMILMKAKGMQNKDIANELSVSEKAVSKWQKRFIESRIEGLKDSLGRGRHKVCNDEDIIKVIRAIIPDMDNHWSIRTLQKKLSSNHDLKVSTATLQRVLATLDLKSNSSENWLESREAEFVPKQLQIAGLYLNPQCNALILSVDEGTSSVNNAEQENTNYMRNGNQSLLTALLLNEQGMDKRPNLEVLDFIFEVVESHPNKTIHVILNYSGEENAKVSKWLDKQGDKVRTLVAPTKEFWLTQIELFLIILANNDIKQGIFSSKEVLVRNIMTYTKKYIDESTPFQWS